MSQWGFNAWGPGLRLVPVTFIAAALWAAPALAQTSVPKAKAPPAPLPSAQATQGPTQTVIPAAKAPEPTFDEGTALRIAAAMLSYSALEVRGGWPALPVTAKLAPGANGPEVVLLRERLVMTEDLPPGRARGEAYAEPAGAGGRRFQPRHGLEQTGTVGPKTLAALNVPVTRRLRQLAASLDRLAATDFKFGQRYVVV